MCHGPGSVTPALTNLFTQFLQAYFGNITYNVFDIGGERIFRKKWIHIFDRTDMILFFVPLSSFNLLLNETARR